MVRAKRSDSFLESRVYWYAHPMRCGRVGVLYDWFDRCTCVRHSIQDLHASTNALHGWRAMNRILKKRIRRVDYSCIKGKRATSHQRSTENPCVGCNTTNVCHLKIDNGFLVCERCGTENGRAPSRDDYKDAHDVDGKRTARLDAPSKTNRTDDGLWMSDLKKAAAATSASASAVRGVGCAVAVCNKEVRDSGMDEIAPKTMDRLKNIIHAIQSLTRRVEGMPSVVVSEIKMVAERTFLASVRHGATCSNRRCAVDLSHKPPRGLATKFIKYTLEKLSGGDGITGVSKQHLASLYTDVQNMQCFREVDNSSQQESVATLIQAIDLKRQALEVVCSSMSQCASLSNQKHESVDFSMWRQASGPLEDVKSSKIMGIRSVLSRVQRDFNFHPVVYDGSLFALGNKAFQKILQTTNVIPINATNQQAAFLVLKSVSEKKGLDHCNPRKAMEKIDMSVIDTANIVARLRVSLPDYEQGCVSTENDSFYA